MVEEALKSLGPPADAQSFAAARACLRKHGGGMAVRTYLEASGFARRRVVRAGGHRRARGEDLVGHVGKSCVEVGDAPLDRHVRLASEERLVNLDLLAPNLHQRIDAGLLATVANRPLDARVASQSGSLTGRIT